MIQPRYLLAISILFASCQMPPALRPLTNINQQNAANAIQSQIIPNQVIVRLQPGINPQQFAQQQGLQVSLSLGLNMYLFTGSASLTNIKRDRRALWAEANTRISLPAMNGRPAPEITSLPRNGQPNDQLLPAQYGYGIIGTDKIWQEQPGSPNVIVAVIDSGIDGSHPEFEGQLIPGFDFTLKEPAPGGNVDGYGHGTHVAGVIGARTNNGIGIAGVAPGCKLMPVRIFNDFGHSEGARSAAAVIWAADHGAKVINASWGSPMEGEASKAAYQYAIAKDVVFVAAVGNSGKDDTMYYPGASEEAIGVAATTDIDGWASFSTFGEWVDLAAPGKGILSTYPLKHGNGYRIMEGTSMAAPFVTAAAALVRSQYPDWTQAQVRAQLERTAKDVIMTGKDNYAGNGRIDVARAVREPARF